MLLWCGRSKLRSGFSLFACRQAWVAPSCRRWKNKILPFEPGKALPPSVRAGSREPFFSKQTRAPRFQVTTQNCQTIPSARDPTPKITKRTRDPAPESPSGNRRYRAGRLNRTKLGASDRAATMSG